MKRIQLYSDRAKTKKGYPITLSEYVIMEDGRTVTRAIQDIVDEGEGLEIVNTFDDLSKIKKMKDGRMAYVKEQDLYYRCKGRKWIIYRTEPVHYTGRKEPVNKEVLWIENSGDDIDSPVEYLILDEVKSIIKGLQNQIVKLEERVKYLEENGVVNNQGGSGDSLLTEDGFILTTEDNLSLSI